MSFQQKTCEEIAALIGSSPNPIAIGDLASHMENLKPTIEAVKTALADKKRQALVPSFIDSSLSASTKFGPLLVLEVFDVLLPLAADAKLAKIVTPLIKKALTKSLDCKILLSAYLPILIQNIAQPPQNKWKLKVIVLELVAEISLLTQLNSTAPKLLQHHMAHLVSVLVECSKEVRSEIKSLSAKLLEEVGLLVKCAEIKAISEKLVNCLKNFGNMKIAADTLYLIANTTFLSYVDAASFALLFPIVERAMKERDFVAKKNGLMIVGAAVTLIADPEILDAYLGKLLPLLQELSLEPVFELRREATKSLGSLGKNIPSLLENEALPWAVKTLQCNSGDAHDSVNARTGAATALSEILSSTKDKTLLERIVLQIVKPTSLSGHKKLGAEYNSFPERRAGVFELLEILCKTDVFEGIACQTCFSWILMGLRDESSLVADAALSAGKSLILNYGGGNADKLVAPLADAVLSFDNEIRACGSSPKARAITLFRELVERLGEFRTYGTDMWTMTTCSLQTRLTFLSLLQISRADPDAEIRRQSNKTLNEQYTALTKAKKEMQPVFLATVKAMLSSADAALADETKCGDEKEFWAQRKRAAQACLADQRANARDCDFSEEKYTAAEVASSAIKPCSWGALKTLSEEELTLLKSPPKLVVRNEDTEVVVEEGHTVTEWKDLEGLTLELLKTLVACEKTVLRSGDHLAQTVIVNAVLESLTVDSCISHIRELGNVYGGVEADFHALLTSLEQGLKEKVYADYHPRELRKLENPEEVLCHVEDLILMYGGGHMLLKETTFELRKGKRYGVVGRNGTGKTTLMNLLASGGVPGVPKDMTCTHVKPEVLDKHMGTKCFKFMELENPSVEKKALEEILIKVAFPENLWNVTVGELSGGWRMRLLIAGAMMKKSDVLLLDEPTNHLDSGAVTWLSDYLVSLDQSAIMVISHDPGFLNRVCTNIINYNSGKLVYYDGNFDAFTARMGINAADAEALLAGQVAVSEKGVEREMPKTTSTLTLATEASAEDGDETPGSGETTPTADEKKNRALSLASAVPAESEASAPAAAAPDRKAKIVFPIAGKVKGLTSLAKPVLEIQNLTYAYNEQNGDVIKGVSAKITMNSRIHIKGVNGAGKTTFMNLICGEVHPNASACEQKGKVERHRNCRLAYMAQQHMHHMADFMETSPYIYIQKRYANGYDGALQHRLMTPANEEEAEDRKVRAKKFGKYGNMLKNLVGRQLRGKDLYYEAQWEGLEDTSKNTWINMKDLRNLGCESFALAYDDRAAAIEGGVADRPLSQREIVKHLEQFGITEELALNRNIGMFSAGQKSKVSLAAAFWIKPHLVALDEPTNYIDMETLDALTTALQRFKGGVICISHCADFVSKVATESWHMEGGALTITKLDNEASAKSKK